MKKSTQSSSEPSTQLLISYLNLRKTIGVLGVALPVLLVAGDAILSGGGVQRSISYYHHTIMRDLFVGVLFLIAALLFTYKGYAIESCAIDNIVSHLGCAFAIGVAIFPCLPDHTLPGLSPSAVICHRLHFTSAILFFITLIYFCLVLFVKTDQQQPKKPKRCRNKIYRLSGYIMLGSMIFLGFYFIALRKWLPDLEKVNLVFWFESLMLWAFGLSWLTKGQAILKDHEEDKIE